MKINIENTLCPVCGYNLETRLFSYENETLYFSPEITGEICPSCGCEFDFDLLPNEASYKKNRIKWISKGMLLRSPTLIEEIKHSNQKWNPITQLKNIDVNLLTPAILESYKKEIPNIASIIDSFK